MMIQQPQTVFKVNSHSVTYQTLQKISKQTEYYFSLSNLITDHFLRNIINCSLGGWVKNQILTNFKLINSIIENQVSNKLTNGQKKLIITKACEQSSFLQVNTSAVRRTSLKTGIKDFSNVIYCQNIDFNQLSTFLQQAKVTNTNDIFTQKAERWFFIQFFNKDSTEVQQIFQYLHEKVKLLENASIINGNDFVSLQKQYVEIVGLNPLETSIRKSQQTQYLIPGRIISYEEAIEFSQKKKTKIIKSKGKLNKSRLPRKYISGNPSNNHLKNSKKEKKLIQIQGCSPKRKKTNEEAKAYQQKKMEQRLRKKKVEKDKKMNIQKQLLNKKKQQIIQNDL